MGQTLGPASLRVSVLITRGNGPILSGTCDRTIESFLLTTLYLQHGNFLENEACQCTVLIDGKPV